MKKLVLISTALTMSLFGTAHATNLVNGDGSNFSEVCIAAATSDDVLKAKVKEFGFTKKDLRSFTCNGLPIEQFARRYSSKEEAEEAPVKIYSFSAENSEPETQICIASLKSKQELAMVSQKLYGSKKPPAISCNGMSLEHFMKRYK